MRIADSVLGFHVRHVYWIGGGTCGGKTTIADLMAKKHGIAVFHAEDHYSEYRKLARPEDHPHILAPSLGLEADLNRPVDERVGQIRESDREYFEWVLMDAIKLSRDASVVVEGHMLDPDRLLRLVPDNRMVFLFADEPAIRTSFYGRGITASLERAIDTFKGPEQTRRHVLEVVVRGSAEKLAEARATAVRCLIRHADATLEQTLMSVENHFALPASEKR